MTEYFADHNWGNEAMCQLTAPVKRRRKTEQGHGEGPS